MDGELIQKILLYVLTGFVTMMIWGVKGIAKLVFENRDKIKDEFFKVNVLKEQVVQNRNSCESHDKRLDIHDKQIDRIITTHNATACGKNNKIEV